MSAVLAMLAPLAVCWPCYLLILFMLPAPGWYGPSPDGSSCRLGPPHSPEYPEYEKIKYPEYEERLEYEEYLNILRLPRTTRVYQNHAWFKPEFNRPPKQGPRFNVRTEIPG
jgi:hypothetical protein